MKKALIVVGILGALILIAVGGVLVAASTQPDVLHVERSTTVAAAPQDVYPLIDDYHQFVKWSPWSALDPDQTTEISDPPGGVDAWYSWSGNEDVGSGKMTTTAVEENVKVVQDLHFIEPFESQAEVALTIEPRGEDQVEVHWTFDQESNLMAKAMGLFMDMDAMLGADFEKGLASLGTMAEAAAQDRLEAEREVAEAAVAAGIPGGEVASAP